MWIRDAPVIGQDDPENILEWIDERITCHIPDEKNNPDLHRFVTRYQMHIANERTSVVVLSLPGADLVFLARSVKVLP